MRAFAVTLFLAGFFALNLRAQTEDKSNLKKFSFELSAGVTFAFKDIRPVYQVPLQWEEKTKPGYEFNLKTGYNFSRLFSVNVGIGYTKLEYWATYSQLMYYDWESEESLDLIDFPLIFRFQYPVKKFIPFVETGLSYSRLVSSSITFTQIYKDNQPDETFTGYPEHNQNNGFFMATLGNHFVLKPGMISIKVTYQMGLNELYTREISHFPQVYFIPPMDSYRLNYFSINIGWIFN